MGLESWVIVPESNMLWISHDTEVPVMYGFYEENFYENFLPVRYILYVSPYVDVPMSRCFSKNIILNNIMFIIFLQDLYTT